MLHPLLCVGSTVHLIVRAKVVTFDQHVETRRNQYVDASAEVVYVPPLKLWEGVEVDAGVGTV